MRHWTTFAFAALVTLCALAICPLEARAAYPSKTIRIVVPYPPGGFNDTLARTLAQRLSAAWGKSVVVDNRPGGGTIIGTELVARAQPDGHTLLIASFAFAANPGLYRKLPFDSAKDFAPVVLAAAAPNVLVAHPSLPAKHLREFIAYAKQQRGTLNYGSGGNGSSPHLAMELLKRQAEIEMQHVPYKGSAPAVADLLAGRVPVMFDNVPNVLGHIRAGRLKALAVTSTRRSAVLPSVVTIAEGGIKDFDVSVWFAVMSPARTPREEITKLNRAINAILAAPEVRTRFAAQGVYTVGGTPEALGEHVQAEMTKWAAVVKSAGVRLD